MRSRAAALAALAGVMVAMLATGSLAGSKIQQGTLIHLADGDVQGDVDRQARASSSASRSPRRRSARCAGARRHPRSRGRASSQATAFAPACAQLAVAPGTAERERGLPLPERVDARSGAGEAAAGDGVVPRRRQRDRAPPPTSCPFPASRGHIYDGHVLVEEHDVVVVTINYRLGVFGFFGHAALAGEDPSYPYAGNQGLLDQRAALEWVRANIAAFGGNPKKVTIFGESAGSVDVCFQIVSPGSRKLFHRAISESGGCTTRQDTAAEGAATAEAFAAAVGCAGAADELACLRQVPPGTLLAAAAPRRSDRWSTAASCRTSRARCSTAGKFARRALHPRLATPTRARSSSSACRRSRPRPSTSPRCRHATARGPTQVAALYPASSFPTPQDALERVVGDSGLVCGTYDTARRAAAGGAAHVPLQLRARAPDSRPAGARSARLPRRRRSPTCSAHHAADAGRRRARHDRPRLLDEVRPHRRSERARRAPSGRASRTRPTGASTSTSSRAC